MKLFSLKSKLVAATAATAILSSGMAVAEESNSNNIMMGFNPFGSSNISATAPDYMIGLKVSETLMPYGYVTLADRGGNSDTAFGIGGGARLYLGDISNRIRPFAGGALGIYNETDTGFGLGAFFGAEAMITDGISISGQIGAEIGDRGCTGCDTAIELGTANVMFNLYF
ncbi:hypothetical protein [Marinobacter sediminicola]|uniref:hypothetical protein n=1 Tax=Marinobacter sediminicola TaxID=3072994 RepID=UPI00281182E8|nr:hypothetical protein [Marinobacter sp. F26243]